MTNKNIPNNNSIINELFCVCSCRLLFYSSLVFNLSLCRLWSVNAAATYVLINGNTHHIILLKRNSQIVNHNELIRLCLRALSMHLN